MPSRALILLGSFAVALAAAHAVADPGAAALPAVDALGPLKAVAAFLQTFGSLGFAVVAGWWGLKKDKETKDLTVRYEAQSQATYNQAVGLVKTMTEALVKMEATVSALRGVIESMERRLE